MPKQKTHKGMKKRVKVTAKGKVKHHKAGASHLMSTKDAKTLRGLRKATCMDDTMAKKARRSLGLD